MLNTIKFINLNSVVIIQMKCIYFPNVLQRVAHKVIVVLYKDNISAIILILYNIKYDSDFL